MYYIYLKLNARAQKICNTSTRVLEYNGDTEPTEAEIADLIISEFEPSFVESVEEIRHDFAYVKIGDILKYVNPRNNEETIVEVISVWDLTANKEFTVSDRSAQYWNNEHRMNMAGYEIGMRKNRPYVVAATEDEIQMYNEAKNIQDSYNEILNLLEYREEWDESDFVRPRYLNVETVVAVRNMLREARANYYANN